MHVEIPRLSALARHAVPRIVEGSLIPVGLFLLLLRYAGLVPAMLSGLGWSVSMIVLRLARKRRVPGLLVLGLLTLTARAVIACATGSAFLYFLQPSLATAAIACAFFVSALVRRPFAGMLALDFCPLQPEVVDNHHVQRAFRHITVLWGVVQLSSAIASVWLLVTLSTSTYVLARTALSMTLTPLAIVASTLLFIRVLRREGIGVRFAPRVAVAAP